MRRNFSSYLEHTEITKLYLQIKPVFPVISTQHLHLFFIFTNSAVLNLGSINFCFAANLSLMSLTSQCRLCSWTFKLLFILVNGKNLIISYFPLIIPNDLKNTLRILEVVRKVKILKSEDVPYSTVYKCKYF